MKPGSRSHGSASLKLSHNTTVPAHIRGGVLEVSEVFTPAEDRRKGCASLLMQKVCAEADAAGKVLLLMPKPYDEGGPDQAELVDWYSRHGFDVIQANPMLMARRAGALLKVKMKPLIAAMN